MDFLVPCSVPQERRSWVRDKLGGDTAGRADPSSMRGYCMLTPCSAVKLRNLGEVAIALRLAEHLLVGGDECLCICFPPFLAFLHMLKSLSCPISFFAFAIAFGQLSYCLKSRRNLPVDSSSSHIFVIMYRMKFVKSITYPELSGAEVNKTFQVAGLVGYISSF